MTASAWVKAEWGELATLEYGRALRDYRASSGSTAVYGTNGRIGSSDVAPQSAGPGVIIGRKGAYRGVHFSPDQFFVIDTAFWLKPKSPIDLRWAYYELLTHDLNSMDSGSAIPSTSRDAFYRMPVLVPPIAVQRGIAATLGAIDDKLVSNHRLIALIPKLIRARIALAASRDSSIVPVASLARFINGGAYTKGASGTGRMVLRIAELNSGPGRSTVYSDIEVPEDKTAHAGDILMSWSGSLDVYRWFRDEAIINQHIFKVIPTGYPSWLVFDRLEAVMPVFKGIAQDKATTMGHIQRGHLESTTIDLPSAEEIEELDSALGPLWERLLLAERENVKLGALRDALLPELLSGRIRVGEVAELVP